MNTNINGKRLALISIGDKVAWWPVKMPMRDLKTLDNCEEFPQD
jgi:hypothetical protein